MTPPVRPDTNPDLLAHIEQNATPLPPAAPPDIIVQMRQALAEARAAGASDEQMDFLLRAWTREVKNVNEAEQLAAAEAVDQAHPLNQTAGMLGAFSKDIPGMEAAQAGIRSLTRDVPYREALGDIRDAYESAPKGVRIPARIVGGGAAAAMLPGSPAMAGALYGGSLNALSADPDQSLLERGIKTGTGALIGGTVGKVADVVGTGIRAARAPRIEDRLRELSQMRSRASSPLYREAIEQGTQAGTRTPAIQAFLAEPDIAPIVERLGTMRQFAGLAPEDPRVLDAIYKELSDQARAVAKPLAGYDPTKPNLARAGSQNVGMAKDQFLQAVSRDVDAPMPAYGDAVAEFARGSRAIDATKRGYQAMRTAASAGGSPDNLVKHGPASLMDFLEGQAPELADEAATGALGYIRRSVGAAGPTGFVNPLRTTARNALFHGGDVLRGIEGEAPKTLLDFLQRGAISAGTPNLGN